MVFALLSIPLYLGSAAALLLAIMFAAEVIASLAPTRKHPSARNDKGAAIIVPAHNEAAIISDTLVNVKTQMRSTDRLIVVADNCTDHTADVARQAGAECLERHNATQRGKGYALQFALDALRDSPPDIVVFIDADCLLGAGALDKLIANAKERNRPVQALYLMKAPKGASPRLQVAAFAWLLMNQSRMLGLHRLFGATRFTGAGLALPWRAIAEIDLASGEIVEDLSLTFRLIEQGDAPYLLSDALVTSEFPMDEAARAKQSARWAHGSLSIAAQHGRTYLARGITARNPALSGAAFDLFIPPLTLFAAGIAALIVLTSAIALFGIAGPLRIALAASGVFFAALLLAWARFGRDALPLSALPGFAGFIVSKAGVYGAKGRKSAKRWTPTRGE